MFLICGPYIPFVFTLAIHTTYGQRDMFWTCVYELVVYHILLALTVSSYFSAYLTPPGSPPFELPLEGRGDEEEAIGLSEMLGVGQDASRALLGDAEAGTQVVSVMAKATNGGQRFCRKCNVPKPDRHVPPAL